MREEGHLVGGYFYNPNVQPYSEYLKRKAEVERWAKGSGLNVVSGDYELERFFEDVDYAGTKEERCLGCWWMRLEKSGAHAKENGFDAFTTTLLGSPYQDSGAIVKIGEDIAARCGIRFYAADFASGFRSAHDEARSKGIYCQGYCGCVFSEKERIEAKAAKEAGSGGGKGRTITVGVKGSRKKIRCSM
jgi:predicted adenine nucleotide alpha hydrolase (AANH) superfamily ATPase